MRIHRLFGIVYYLLNKRESTAVDLAAYFEVSVRTIYRDIDHLCEAGIPLYTHQGRNGGVYLLNTFALNTILLTEAEQQQILTSLIGLSQREDASAIPLLITKLEHLFKQKTVTWIEVDHNFWSAQQGEKNKYEQIKQAILATKQLHFTYFNNAGQQSLRHIDPYQLYFRSYMWYVKGFCHLKKAYRIFKVSRMSQLQQLETDTLMPYVADAFDRHLPQLQLITLQLRFKPEVGHRVYDEFSEATIRQDANGDLYVTTLFPHEAWLLGYLLSFGAHLEIIAPPLLRTELQGSLAHIAANYSEIN